MDIFLGHSVYKGNLCVLVADWIRSALVADPTDRRETLHVKRVGHEHENSQGLMTQ